MSRRRNARAVVESPVMPPPGVPDFERELLRRGVGALVAHRHACRVCRRTPLVGERVHVYADEKLACELCQPLLGESPLRAEIVRSSQFGHAVRLRAA